MGTGSFGGGSGSIGGGGAGGRGSGGSLLRAIESLRDIGRRLTADGDQARLTREINGLLRDRGRAAFVKDLLADPFVDALLRDLLEIKRKLDAGESWAAIAASYGVRDEAGVLTRFCDERIDAALRARDYNVDERYLECASAAFRGFLHSAVGGDFTLVANGNGAAVDAALDKAAFRNSVGGYLGGLLAETIRKAAPADLGAAWPAVAKAADAVAIGIYDRFQSKFVSQGKATPADALRILSDNYASLVAP